MGHVSQSICLFLLLVNTSTLVESVECNNLDPYVYIRNAKAGLVLDAKNGTYVTTEVADASLAQQWQLHPSSTPGVFNLVNRDSGNALDVDLADSWAVMNVEDDSMYQQWFIDANGTISNNGLVGFVLDLRISSAAPGVGIFLNVYSDTLYNSNDQVYSLDRVEETT